MKQKPVSAFIVLQADCNKNVLLQNTPQIPDGLFAKADATEAVFKGYRQFHSALEEIAADDRQDCDTISQANALADHLCTLEVSRNVLWNEIIAAIQLMQQVAQKFHY